MGVTLPLFLQKLFLIGEILSVNFIIGRRLLVKIFLTKFAFLVLLIYFFLLFVLFFLYFLKSVFYYILLFYFFSCLLTCGLQSKSHHCPE